MIGQKSDKCDMRVLRVHVTWFLYFCQKIPTQNPCNMRDMCDMHDIHRYGTGYMKVWDLCVTCILISEKIGLKIPVTCVTYVTCLTYQRLVLLDPCDPCDTHDMRDIHFDYLKKMSP